MQIGQIGPVSSGGTAGSYMYDEYKLLDTFVVLAEYGYRFPLSQAISLQPTLGAGAVIGGLSSYQEYAMWPAGATSYVPTVTTSTSVWASPAAQLRFDLVFMEKQPVSFYIGTGYFIYTRELAETNHALDTNVLINGIKLEGALMIYF